MWSGTGRGCLGSGGITIPEVLKKVGMWHLGPWFKGDHGSTGLMAGFNDLRGLSNLHNSMILVVHLPLSTTCKAGLPQKNSPGKSQEGIKKTPSSIGTSCRNRNTPFIFTHCPDITFILHTAPQPSLLHNSRARESWQQLAAHCILATPPSQTALDDPPGCCLQGQRGKQAVAWMGFKAKGSAACMRCLNPAQLHQHGPAFARHVLVEVWAHHSPPGLPHPSRYPWNSTQMIQ